MPPTFSESNQEVRTRIDQFLISYMVSPEKTALYREYESDLRKVTPQDLFHLRYFSDQSPLSPSMIQSHAGRFVNLFFHGLSAYAWNRKAAPMLERFLSENHAILERLEAIKPSMEAAKFHQSADTIRAFYRSLEEIGKKFTKMQNILYPVLERRLPTTMPFRVLWMVEDELMALRPKIVEMLSQSPIDWTSTIKAIGHFHYELAGLIQKEELIVFPVASEIIDGSTWESMQASADDIGYAFLSIDPFVNSPVESPLGKNRIHTATGDLTFAQFESIMRALPVALTYVDENDRVIFYNQTKERHFPRTPQAIGREVRHCHPEKSVHVVETILQEFKAGNREEAIFWMDFHEKKVLISYFAVRDPEGRYKGILEVTQDISKMASYQGEQRLLDWK